MAAHTFDAAGYLLGLDDGAGTTLDTDFAGEVVGPITHHAPCDPMGNGAGGPAGRLLGLTGASVTEVTQCAGVDGMWGWRRGNEDVAIPLAQALGEGIRQAGGDVVVGDCHLANTVITEQTGRVPVHSLQVLARAYGIESE